MINEAVMLDDVRLILEALGLGGHARPISAHAVVRDEILPAIARLRAEVGSWRRIHHSQRPFGEFTRDDVFMLRQQANYDDRDYSEMGENPGAAYWNDLANRVEALLAPKAEHER